MFKKTQKVDQLHIENIKNNILNTSIRGVDSIIATDIIKSKKSYIDKDGSIKNKPIYQPKWTFKIIPAERKFKIEIK